MTQLRDRICELRREYLRSLDEAERNLSVAVKRASATIGKKTHAASARQVGAALAVRNGVRDRYKLVR